MGMTIGEFSRLTGLTPRALRIYDERGILRPDYTAAGNGRREYSEAQVRQGFTIKTMRDAGVSLADLECLEAFDLDEFRAEVARKRRVEDEALTVCEALEKFDPAQFSVTVTEADVQPWVGVGLTLTWDENSAEYAEFIDESNDFLGSCLGLVGKRLGELEIRAVGPWWTTFRQVEMQPKGKVRLQSLLCLPVSALPHTDELQELQSTCRAAFGTSGLAESMSRAAVRQRNDAGAVAQPDAEDVVVLGECLPRRREVSAKFSGEVVTDVHNDPDADASLRTDPEAILVGMGPLLAVEDTIVTHGFQRLGVTDTRQLAELDDVTRQPTGMSIVVDVEP